jgi:hypothetical protein
MRRIVALVVFAFCIGSVNAQHRGGAIRGFGFRHNTSGSVYPYGFGSAWLPPDWPLNNGYLPNVAGNYTGYLPQPIVVVQQAPPPPPVVEPPREVHSVIIDFPPPSTAAPAPPEGEPQRFGIVMKDGSVRSAKAVVVLASDGLLQYIDPDERHVRISVSDIDRQATRKLNSERKLTLWLPAPPQSVEVP